jgi:hypothetical protein
LGGVAAQNGERVGSQWQRKKKKKKKICRGEMKEFTMVVLLLVRIWVRRRLLVEEKGLCGVFRG